MEKRINSLSGGGGIAQEKERRGRLFYCFASVGRVFFFPKECDIDTLRGGRSVCIDRTRLGGDCVFDLFSFLHPGQ